MRPYAVPLFTVAAVGLVLSVGCGQGDSKAPPPPTFRVPKLSESVPTAPIRRESVPGEIPPSDPTKEVTTATGLRYEDLEVGKGRAAEPNDMVEVHYTGWLSNGTKFDSSYDQRKPFEFQLSRGQVIKGWDQGVKGMKVGGRRKLIIPPQLGYGEPGSEPAIPPNAELIFEIELLKIK